MRQSYDLGALGTTEEAAELYRRRGWLAWARAPAHPHPRRREPTVEEEGWVLVLPGPVPLDLDGELTCDWRDGDVW